MISISKLRDTCCKTCYTKLAQYSAASGVHNSGYPTGLCWHRILRNGPGGVAFYGDLIVVLGVRNYDYRIIVDYDIEKKTTQMEAMPSREPTREESSVQSPRLFHGKGLWKTNFSVLVSYILI